MKIKNKILYIFFVICTINYNNLLADASGTAFWFAMPKVVRLEEERINNGLANSALTLIITSQRNATVNIKNSSGQLISSTINVEAGSYKIVPLIDSLLEHKVSGQIETNKSLYIESDIPIEVSAYVGYTYSGEMYKILPIDMLDKEYYTFNLYNDLEYIDSKRMLYYTPGEILIIATEDNTQITITPKYDIKNGPKKDSTAIITLNRGQSYLMLSTTSRDELQKDSTDLSGTHIIANKKISVISGHTKGAFPKLPNNDKFPNILHTHNLLIENLIPVKFATKEFITIPFKYNIRRVYDDFFGCDSSYVIRIIATEDNTALYETIDDGSKVTIARDLKKGDIFDVNDKRRSKPGLFFANKPVMVAQYTKGYAGNWTQYGGYGSETYVANHIGQGSMTNIIGNEYWTDKCKLIGIPKVNNFINLICKSSDTANIFIKYKNESGNTIINAVNTEYPADLKKVPGSDYSYLSVAVSPGLKEIYSSEPYIKFMVYTYGDMSNGNIFSGDSAFAYSTFAAIGNVNYNCRDSVVFYDSTFVDYKFTGKVRNIPLNQNPECGNLVDVIILGDDKQNAILKYNKVSDNQIEYTIELKNYLLDTKFTLVARNYKLKNTEKEFVYTAPNLTLSSNNINFGLLNLNESSEAELIIKNTGSQPIIIDKLYLAATDNVFSFNELNNITINSNEIKKFKVNAQITQNDRQQSFAKINAKVGNDEFPISKLEAYLNILNFTPLQINYGTVRWFKDNPTATISITNNSNSPIKINSHIFANQYSIYSSYLTDNSNMINPGQSVNIIVILEYFRVQNDMNIEDTLILTFDNNEKYYKIPVKANIIKEDLFGLISTNKALSFNAGNYSDYNLKLKLSAITNNIYVDSMFILDNGTSIKINQRKYDETNPDILNLNTSFLVSQIPPLETKYDLMIRYYGYVQKIGEVTLNPNSAVRENNYDNNQVYSANEIIQFKSEMVIESIEIYNEAGKKIKTYNVNAEKFEINANTLNAGTYFYKINCSNRQTGGKFIIK